MVSEKTIDNPQVFDRVLRVMLEYGFDFDVKSYNIFGEERPSAWEHILSITEFKPGQEKSYYDKQLNQMRVIITKYRKRFELYRFLDHISTALMILLLDESQ